MDEADLIRAYGDGGPAFTVFTKPCATPMCAGRVPEPSERLWCDTCADGMAQRIAEMEEAARDRGT